MLVSGEGGIGKTRLVREAAARAGEQRRFVVWARPEQIARPGPFAMILDLAENVAARRDDAAGVEAASIAASFLESTDLSSGPAARRIAARLRGVFAQAGPRSIAVFEDLHVADEASHAVVLHLARSASEDGCFIIGTYRPEELGASEELERFLDAVAKERLATDVRLGALSKRDSVALASSMLEGAATEGQTEWIAAQAEGVPFYIEEMTAAYLQTRSMQGVPESISRTVQARASRLGAVAIGVARAAALAGGPIDAKVLAVALDLDPSAVSRSLADAARAGLIEDREGKLVFRHALVREAMASSMVSVEAQEMHRRLAQAIEQVHDDAVGRYAKSLARHWYEGRDAERALRYALEAGERALSLAATHEARLAYELAGACTPVPSPSAMMGLAEVDIREARMSSASELFERAGAAFQDQGRTDEAVHAMSRLAWVHAVERRYDEAFDILHSALALVPEGDGDAQRAVLLAQLGRMFSGGRDQERLRALDEAAAIGTRLSNHAVVADALDGLAWQAYREHRVSDGIRLGEEACDAAMSAGRPEAIGRSHNNCALIHSACGDPRRGLALLAVARERLKASFGSFGVQFIDTTEALMRMRMGEPGSVASIVARLDVSWKVSRGTVQMLQAWAALHGGEAPRAHAILDAARESADSVEVQMGDLLVGVEEEDERVVAVAEDILGNDWSLAVADDEGLALVLAGRALLISGKVQEAEAATDRLEQLMDGFGAANWIAAIQELRGMIAMTRGDRAESAARLAAAAEAYALYPNAVDRARCLRVLASLQSDKDQAIAHLKDARTLSIEAGSTLEVARTEAALRALGVRPRAGRPKKGSTPTGLSPREVEVAALVAAGATNAEIAARLFLSERTVQDHITHALRKLSLTGRAGLAAWAAKHGLI